MKSLFTRYLLVSSVSVLACVNLTAEEESESQNSIDDVYMIGVSHWDGAQKNEEGEWEEAHGWDTHRTLVETSKDLITDVSKLPKKFKRPQSTQNIFRQGEWALVANPHWEDVQSTDGHLSVDVSELRVSFITSNWKPTDEIELSYQLSVDGTHELQSKYETVSSNYIAEGSWKDVSEEFIKAMEEGETIRVSLIDKGEETVHFEEFSLSGLSENLTAVRKLLKDSPREERED